MSDAAISGSRPRVARSSLVAGGNRWQAVARVLRSRPVRQLLVCAVCAALPGACSPSRVIEAAQVLGDLAAGTGESVLKDGTPMPARRIVAYRVSGRRYTADIYIPGGAMTAPARLVLVPGLTPDGKDDARLVAFAYTLARARFTVLVPDIGNLRALKVKSTDARAIADAARHLGARDAGAVGIAAVSYAAGPAILAALGEDVRCRVGLVLAIGGYYDSRAMMTFMTTGAYRDRPEGPWRRHPRRNPHTRWIALSSHADLVDEPADRFLLAAISRRKRAAVAARVDDLVRRLGAGGRAVYDLIANDDPDRVPALVAALPDAVRREMAALDLKSRDLGRLAARLILVHGRDDPVIPHTESMALAAAAPEGRADLYLPGSLSHVDFGPGGIFDTLLMWRAIYRVLEERDALRETSAGSVAGCELTGAGR